MRCLFHITCFGSATGCSAFRAGGDSGGTKLRQKKRPTGYLAKPAGLSLGRNPSLGRRSPSLGRKSLKEICRCSVSVVRIAYRLVSKFLVSHVTVACQSVAASGRPPFQRPKCDDTPLSPFGIMERLTVRMPRPLTQSILPKMWRSRFNPLQTGSAAITIGISAPTRFFKSPTVRYSPAARHAFSKRTIELRSRLIDWTGTRKHLSAQTTNSYVDHAFATIGVPTAN